jgi:hypothetical protein
LEDGTATGAGFFLDVVSGAVGAAAVKEERNGVGVLWWGSNGSDVRQETLEAMEDV